MREHSADIGGESVCLLLGMDCAGRCDAVVRVMSAVGMASCCYYPCRLHCGEGDEMRTGCWSCRWTRGGGARDGSWSRLSWCRWDHARPRSEGWEPPHRQTCSCHSHATAIRPIEQVLIQKVYNIIKLHCHMVTSLNQAYHSCSDVYSRISEQNVAMTNLRDRLHYKWLEVLVITLSVDFSKISASSGMEDEGPLLQ